MSIRELQRVLVSHGYSLKTRKAYVGWATRLSEHCGESLETLSSSSVVAFLQAQKRRGLKDESLRQTNAAIRYYYRNVVDRPDIVSALPHIQSSRRKTHIPDKYEIEEIISAIANNEFRNLFYMIYGAGLELGEALTLQVKAVNPKNNTLSFKTQRNKLRVTPIPIKIAAYITEIASTRRHTEFLFQNKGRMISKTTAQRAWAGARRTVHADPRTDVRSLRHAYIHHLTQQGYLVQEVLHHMQLNAAVALAYYSKYVDIRDVDVSPLDVASAQSSHDATIFPYVSQTRIAELSTIDSARFDLSRGLSILREINDAARSGSLHSIPLLLRMFIDHTAPIFGKMSFSEVVNNTPMPKSLKKNMVLLNNNLRNVADLYLHNHISNRVSLPTVMQVDFRQSLDQYLGFMTSVLRGTST